MKQLSILLLSLMAVITSPARENVEQVEDISAETLPEVFVVPQLRFIDDIRWYDFDMSSVTDFAPSLTAPQLMRGNPYAADFSGNGAIASWSGGYIGAYGTRSTLPGLMSIETGGITITQKSGKLSLTISADANKYGYFRGLHTNYSFHGSATFTLTDNLALTLFGSYYSDAFYHSPAAMPYIGQTAYGGYMTWSPNGKSVL